MKTSAWPPAAPLAARAALSAALAALAGAESPTLTAQALLAHVLGITRSRLLAHPELPVAPDQRAAYEQLVARAALGEPLAYLTGQREFHGLDFLVEPGVLVPRPETELLVDLALARRPGRILDVGTGSGCIAVALAANLPQAVITAVDLSPAALAVARRNARRHGVLGRLTFLESDLLSALPASSLPAPGRPASSFQLIAANLPYVDRGALCDLPVARHEPWLALDGGPGGLALVGRLLRQAGPWLAPGGALLLEIGAGQGPAAQSLAYAAFPAARCQVHPDLAGHDRVLEVALPGPVRPA
ncbi:MAG: peptide chain release factor N(5)-glutamine methyltransferase [Anaerolineales bacterium]|nr:peptide chain release factor N(5)-glutamine methyltransferase [Anaerolineales bacterium]